MDLLLLDGGWTTKSPADGNKSLSLPKSICSQEVVSSCLGKDLSAWRRSTNSGTDYSVLRSRSYNSKILFLDHSTCQEA